MRRAVMGAILLSLSFCGVPVSLGQEQEEDLGPKIRSQAKPSIPPPAWKSVEIGDFYLKRKKYNAALSRYREAVKVDPYYAPGYLGLAKVYERIGLKRKALESYQKYLDLLPSAKDAEEAKAIHNAIARLEGELARQRSRPRTREPTRPH